MRYNRGHFNRKGYNTPAPEPEPSHDLKLSATVSGDISRPMDTAVVRYTKALNGSTLLWTDIQISMVDHLGASHVVFVGEYHGRGAELEPGGNSEEFTADDYGYYLADNPLDNDQLSLLDPAKQDLTNYQRLDFDNIVVNFTAGRLVKGQTSGAMGKIAATQNTWLYATGESYLVPAYAMVLTNIVGTFEDNETIKEVSGTGEALVDGGAFVPLDFGPDTIYPETWVYNLLGGANWLTTTRIYPYRINPTHPVTVTWDQAPWDNWNFPSEEKKRQALDDVSEYHNFIVHIKPKSVAGVYYCCFYWVHMDDIDNADDYAQTEHRGLSLPAAVTITKGDRDSGLMGRVTPDIQGSASKNKVRVIGQAVDGSWFENDQVAGTTCSSGVFYGTEKPRVYLETNLAMLTKALCNDRAALLYAYLSLGISTWKATFKQRVDLELYQKMTFSGYPSHEIPDGDYRIIAIEKDDQCAAVFVTVTLVRVDQFAAQIKMNRTLTNAHLEIKRLIEREQAKIPKAYAGTVTVVDGNDVTGVSEAGQTTITRTLT